MDDRGWNDTIRDAILKCAHKLTYVSLIYRTEPNTKKWEKTKKLKTDMLRSIDKQSGKNCQKITVNGQFSSQTIRPIRVG